MDEDILAELDRHLTDVNLDKYWVKKVGDFELWLTVIDYVHSNKVKKAIEGEFGLEEAKRVTLSAAIVGVNGTDLRPLRRLGKTIKVRGKGKNDELVDLPEYVYRKIASWDVEFVDVVFDVYSDIMESHKKDLVKDLVFENAKTDEEELESLEERASSLRMRLGKPPLVEAVRLEDAPADDGPITPVGEGDEEEAPVEPRKPPSAPSSGESADPEDFDPFTAVPVPTPVSAPSPLVVPVPHETPAIPTTPSAIDRALAARRGSSPLRPEMAQVQEVARVGQPSVPEEVIEKSSARVVVDRPQVDVPVGQQNRNPRFRRSGA